MKAQKMSSPNEGVSCAVNSCHYYMNGNHCGAEKIEIQPSSVSNASNISNSAETDCVTFVQHS